MAIFNDLIPANTEAVKRGAQRIREIKTSLNTALSQIFDDSLVFLTKWVTGAMIQNDASDNTARAINTDHIKTGAVTLPKLPDGIFTANTAGRAKFADGLITGAKLDPAIVFPTASVTAAALADNAVDTAAIQDGAVTLAKTNLPFGRFVIGTYAGSDIASVAITGLPFAPDFILIVGGAASHRTGVAFRNEATALVGPVHRQYDSGSISGDDATAIQWTSDGFVVVPFNYQFNDAGKTHSYIAVKA